LFVLRDGKETALTTEGGGRIRCGLAEFIAMEELGRHEGYWWSKDSSRIAYVRTDSSAVPLFFMHDYLDPRGRPVEQEYPRAGDPNATWELRVVPAAGGEAKTMRVRGEYLVRVDWMPDGALAVQVSDRLQRNLVLYRCDPENGTAKELFTEIDAAWVRFHRNLRTLEDGRLLWTSERSGRRHIYLWGEGGLRPLTSGDWDVAAVLGVDERAGTVAFTGSRESPRERHLYRVGLDGKGLRRLSRSRGWHGVKRSKKGRWFLDTRSRAGVPPRIVLLDNEGNEAAEIAAARPLPGLPRPEFLTIKADDGTPLAAMLYRGTPQGPAIVYCYGGPGSHLVADRWGGSTYLWHARLVSVGFTVLTLDGRGAGGYGREFSRVVSGRLCDWEVRDQAAGARWLRAQGLADKVGVWGWSYGGTLTLMCLLHAPDAFDAGVAVAPVTDWRDYDTAYTERYLDLPAENPKGYAASSPVTAAASLDRPLLLAHGFMDDNVHFRGAAVFLDRAQKAGRAVEADFYPRGAHGIGGKRERLLLFRRMERFWLRQFLLGGMEHMWLDHLGH
ncbi:MAG: S9 family peptidase, partial [Planctomycetota bacterium]